MMEMEAQPQPAPNGNPYEEFRRIESSRASQRKRRNDEKRNADLASQDDVYRLADRPPVRGEDNPGFESEESLDDLLDDLSQMHPNLTQDIDVVRSFLYSHEVKQAQNLMKTLREEFPHERSLDDPALLSEALSKSQSVNAGELALCLNYEQLREVSGIDSDTLDDFEMEDEALMLAKNFVGHDMSDLLKAVTIDKTKSVLGATVKNVDASVVISRIVAGGAVQRDGRLQEGDEIININLQTVKGKSVDEVCQIMEQLTGHVTFVVIASGKTNERNVENDITHVRTLFSYNPESDEYIPCKELGLFFSKGQILKIHKGDDENWWQAYKEGENDMSNLAGLVPSFEFETRRREMNKEYERELEKENEPVLCGKKKNKKAKKSKKNKKKNKKDDVEEEIVHPYEYVKLHQQPPDRRRPIVLIGPRNVGRYELRDKLTNDKYEEFCVPIAHTSRPKKDGETNGQDYMFVSKDQFEQHKKKGYFVEDGEYQKNLYGTSIESIQQVIERGKTAICVMLAPSIKIMREKMLKPYVIFIKPPNREQILANQRINGKQLDEEEIASMIDQARVIEQDYGHLFDDIIINHNTDDTYEELRNIIKKLDTTPQWVPVSWLDIKY